MTRPARFNWRVESDVQRIEVLKKFAWALSFVVDFAKCVCKVCLLLLTYAVAYRSLPSQAGVVTAPGPAWILPFIQPCDILNFRCLVNSSCPPAPPISMLTAGTLERNKKTSAPTLKLGGGGGAREGAVKRAPGESEVKYIRWW